MTKTLVALATVLIMATAAAAAEKVQPATPTAEKQKMSNKEMFEISSVMGPAAFVTSPVLILAAPHFGIEWANDSAAQIPSEAGRNATQFAIAPFRIAGALLAAPYYLMGATGKAGEATYTWITR